MTLFLLWVGILAGLGGTVYFALRWLESRSHARRAEQELSEFRATEQARQQELEASRARLNRDIAAAKARADATLVEAQATVTDASRRAELIVAEAEQKAQDIAGKAYDAINNAEAYERTARAMRNIIEGYGDEYLKPQESLLDELAEGFSHTDAGQQLKRAREHTRQLIKEERASRCEYVENGRREGAERFVLDAFNGKVDSILSRAKHDNYGKLEQEIVDAFAVVNHGGRAFRDARITDEYLAARLDELRWGTVAHELRKQEIEEQRRIRDQMREEEKARRDYERALRETAKEEEMLRRAMAKAQAQVAAATDEQRAKLEAQLDELNARLLEAEAKNQRALSMAQQTKRGYVYIISNVGSFGDGTYKIGLTRRLDPMDRIWELGDASVPFDFDVHAMILSEDAPALEHQLHNHFLLRQINKVNHRKEYFRVSLAELRGEIERLGVEAKWTMTAQAQEYRETLAIEKAIAADPAARDRWINRQLTLDPVDHLEVVQAEE